MFIGHSQSICFYDFLLQIPESPIWLVAKGKNKKAEMALCWLRGWVKPEAVKPEFLELIHYNEVSGTKVEKINDDSDGLLSKLAHFKDPSVYKPLKLLMIYFFISFISSIFPTRPFMTKIMSTVDLTENQNEALVCIS